MNSNETILTYPNQLSLNFEYHSNNLPMSSTITSNSSTWLCSRFYQWPGSCQPAIVAFYFSICSVSL